VLIRLISADDVNCLLPMEVAIGLMKEAFTALTQGDAVMPERTRIGMPDGDILVMPAHLPEKALSLKAVLTYPGNHARGMPTTQGLVLVFDDATGTPRAVLDAGSLTALRTGAAGGLAADLLARRDARTVALIGCGVQGAKQLEAVRCVRDIDRILCVDSDEKTAAALVEAIRRSTESCTCELCPLADEAVAEADIVITATPSPTPTFDSTQLKAGVHVTALGSYQPHTQEVDAALVQRAFVVAEHRESAAREAGDLILADAEVDAELGQIVLGEAPGRTDDEQLTLFKSVGVAVQDTAAAAWVLEQAEERGVGQLVEL